MVLSPKSKAQGDCALRMPTKEPTSRIPSYCSAHYCRGNKKIKMSAPDKARSKNSDRCAAKVVYRVIIESRVKKQAWRLSCVGTGCLVHAHVVDFRFGPSGQLIKFANDTAWASAGVPAFQAEPGCCLQWPVRRWARRPVVRSAALGVPLGVGCLPSTNTQIQKLATHLWTHPWTTCIRPQVCHPIQFQGRHFHRTAERPDKATCLPYLWGSKTLRQRCRSESGPVLVESLSRSQRVTLSSNNQPLPQPAIPSDRLN